MADVYENVVSKYRGSPTIIVLFFLSFIMLVLGANHFIEDTYSSKIGLENLERAYNLNIQIFQWSYWTMSLAPQIASMVFAYIYLSDTHKKWPLIISLGSQGMDFFADSWYRSNGHLFQSWQVAGISGLLTFVYFSIGSEFFLSVGAGMLIKMLAPMIQTWKSTVHLIRAATKGNYQPPNQGQSNRPNEQRNRPQGGSNQHPHNGQQRRYDTQTLEKLPKKGQQFRPAPKPEPTYHPVPYRRDEEDE
jgi:hypothetical protein